MLINSVNCKNIIRIIKKYIAMFIWSLMYVHTINQYSWKSKIKYFCLI